MHKSRFLHRPNHPSKTVVFERNHPNRKSSVESGLNGSRNSFSLSASQKASVRLSFERVHDDQTEKDHSFGPIKEATPPRHSEGRAGGTVPPAADLAMAKSMLIGYARVSTVEPNLALQRDALTEAGCQRIFTEQMSGAVTDRPALRDALEFARDGDTLTVWKLDRLARSMKQLNRNHRKPAGEGHWVSQSDRSARYDDR